MKTTKGSIRVAHQGVTIIRDEVKKAKHYASDGSWEHETYTETTEYPSDKKIDQLRFDTLDKVMKKLNKTKNVLITGINVDQTFTIVNYEVRS